jgi:hypothetical protein
MSVLALSELPSAERSNVIPFPRKASVLSEELRVRDEVLKECQRRKLSQEDTEDALGTAAGTLAFCMPPDRAIAAGKARAARLAMAMRRPDPEPPQAA